VGLGKEGEKRPYAVVQLRQDDSAASLCNIVGFQTHLKWPEQKRIISLIPGLENASIVRYGVMHRNSYLNSPKVLRQTYQSKIRDDLFFAGQMTGVEGYIESCASGMAAAVNMARLVKGKELLLFPQETMIGSMAHYITHASPDYFQPMNANFGIVPLRVDVRKSERKEAYGKQALAALDAILDEVNHG
ncbi:MAG: FAD-dependent oxidoreductase, partial [Erysipelotrichaceae bacterium]|nr:FAD-dependent oxidoreductase [Erysipelotrichaceae bacterium]